MRGKIFIYLFLFTALLVVFLYVNEKKIFASQEGKIENLKQKLASADSLIDLAETGNDTPYFDLSGNEKAYTYFEQSGVSVTGLQQRIEDAIISQNTRQGNPLIPYENDGGIYRVNKVQVLNHKWVIADFTNGNRWGELLLNYSVNDQGEIAFDNLTSLIYPLE